MKFFGQQKCDVALGQPPGYQFYGVLLLVGIGGDTRPQRSLFCQSLGYCSDAVRPCCRIPIFTTGTPADGTSTTPLDEFPITAVTQRSADR